MGMPQTRELDELVRRQGDLEAPERSVRALECELGFRSKQMSRLAWAVCCSNWRGTRDEDRGRETAEIAVDS